MVSPRPLLGVVHLPATPHRGGSVRTMVEAARRDAAAFAAAGFDGVVVENYGDAPYRKGCVADPVPPDVVAALAVVASAVAAETGLPVGVNCLRNDARAALAVAAAVAPAVRWVRVNVLAGAAVTDQGVIEGEAAAVADYRRCLGVQVTLLADLLVKHAAPLGAVDPAVVARDLAARSGADAMVLSGSRTGEPVDPAHLQAVRGAVDGFPIWIGSGLSLEGAHELWPRCDGAIVGTWCKGEGGAVDRQRAAALRRACPPPA